jgi:hypothetical protein
MEEKKNKRRARGTANKRGRRAGAFRASFIVVLFPFSFENHARERQPQTQKQQNRKQIDLKEPHAQ